ncbi:hypothetical protein FQN54_000615 [Arachnomyces sp. PD_36]|nr:hypothetical protein FQN54_000615 [Arachnomyces sp. PD_36]
MVPQRNSRGVGFAMPENNNSSSRRSSTSSIPASLKSPRAARFAEATTVDSPVDGRAPKSPFSDPPAKINNQPSIADLGFGYVADNDASRHVTAPDTAHVPPTPASPLKSALRVPGTPARTLNPLSPTFREEQILEKQEEKTEAENAKDLKVKIRVRVAKMLLRGVNFSCSLIVLALVASSFVIFNATRHLPPRNDLPAWASDTPIWPQILLITIASISLVFCLGVFYGYFRGGHKRAEKVAVYYTVFSVFFFAFSIIMWAVGAAVLQNSKNSSDNQDMWGWACVDNERRHLFEDDVQYSLVCRMQDWALVCCIIEIVVEILVIAIYTVVFYRFWSKRKLRKSMDVRDKARSDLYLAQLRSQSAPNTPGFTPGFARTPMSPAFPGYQQDDYSKAEEGEYYSTQYATSKTQAASSSTPKPTFQLQPPPTRSTPKHTQEAFRSSLPASPSATTENINEHVAAAPGEQTYESVPIPGSHATPMSPSFPSSVHNARSSVQQQQQQQQQPLGQNPPGMAYTTDGRVESPPTSPRFAPQS